MIEKRNDNETWHNWSRIDLAEKHISYAYDEMWNVLNVCITKDQPPLYALSRAWSDLSVLLAIDVSIKTGENID